MWFETFFEDFADAFILTVSEHEFADFVPSDALCTDLVALDFDSRKFAVKIYFSISNEPFQIFAHLLTSLTAPFLVLTTAVGLLC